MKKILALTFLYILQPQSLPAAAQPGRLQTRDLYQLRSVTDAQISPDGARVAYTVQSGDRPGKPYKQVWLYEVSTGRTIRLGENTGTSSEPRWSPDGQSVAFLGAGGDRSGLMVAKADGTGLTFIAPVESTNHPLESTGEQIDWSPDGRQVAFVSATPGPEVGEAGGDPVVITRYLYKPPASGGPIRFNDDRRLHIFVVDVGTKRVRQLTRGDYYEHSIDWSPAGQEILFLSNREPDPDRFFNYDIFTVRVADGAVHRLTSTESIEYRPRWSPDGRSIVYEGTRRGLTSSETTMEDTHVYLMDAGGGNQRELGARVDNRQKFPGWAPDGRAVYFTVQERGAVRLYRTPTSGGAPEVVVSGPGAVGVWSVAKNGALAFTLHTGRDLSQLYLKGGGGSAKQLIDLNGGVLGGKQIADVEPFSFLSFDGIEVEAFLTKPRAVTADSKHPMIVMIKGGPHGQQGPAFNFKAQAYATRGWATLMVNYRGSTGYGQKFADAIFRDQNGGEAKDVLYGVDAALRRFAWLDPERLGVEGGSYGGQLTNWLITQTPRFKAAIPIAGISNLISFNYMSYYHDYLAVEFGGLPHQDGLMDVLWQRSPLRHVAKVRTPVMLVHGEDDNNVPVAEAEQFYIALKDVGVKAVMVRYPREGHGIRETKHVIDLIDRSIGWYEGHFTKAEGARD